MSIPTDQKSPQSPTVTARPMPDDPGTREALAKMAQAAWQLLEPSLYVSEITDADNEPAWRCPYCGEINATVTARLESTCGCGFKVRHSERLEELGGFTYTFLRLIDQADRLPPALQDAMVRAIYGRVKELDPDRLEEELNAPLIDACPAHPNAGGKGGDGE